MPPRPPSIAPALPGLFTGDRMADDWTLNAEQYNWFAQHQATIDAWSMHDDPFAAMEVDLLIFSDEFAALFGDMSFNEALDRFDCMNEETAE